MLIRIWKEGGKDALTQICSTNIKKYYKTNDIRNKLNY